MSTIGVLALQGGFAAHVRALERLGHRAVEVRTAAVIEDLDGLVLPGGESTTMLKLVDRWDLAGPLDDFVRSGKPVFVTCAGLILAASEVTNPKQRSFGWLDISVSRNAWGRQLDSFEAVSDEGTPLTFIRAPRITRIGAGVERVANLRGEAVLVRQENVTGATFHPELTDDLRVHESVFGRRGDAS